MEKEIIDVLGIEVMIWRRLVVRGPKGAYYISGFRSFCLRLFSLLLDCLFEPVDKSSAAGVDWRCAVVVSSLSVGDCCISVLVVFVVGWPGLIFGDVGLIFIFILDGIS